MQGMAPAKTAILFKLKLLRGLTFVFSGCIVTVLTLSTTQGDYITHNLSYLLLKKS